MYYDSVENKIIIKVYLDIQYNNSDFMVFVLEKFNFYFVTLELKIYDQIKIYIFKIISSKLNNNHNYLMIYRLHV